MVRSAQKIPRWLPFIVGGSTGELATLQSEDWEAAIRLAYEGGVLEALAVRLRVTGSMAMLPLTLQERLARVERLSALQSLTVRRHFIRIARAFATVGVPVVPFKGIVLASTAYPDAHMRPMTDIDLWVRQEQVPAALEALAGIGLIVKATALSGRAWDGEVKLRRAANDDTVVELHHGPYPGDWLHSSAHIDRSAVWERLQPTRLFGQPVLQLTAEDHVLEVALHAAIRHPFSHSPLRQVLDLVFMAREGLDADVLVRRAADWRVTRATLLALTLAAQCFEDEDLERIVAHVGSGGRRGSTAMPRGMPTATSIIEAERLTERPLARVLYFLRIADGWGDAVRFMRRTVWPAPAWLRARHGDDGFVSRLKHLVRLIRRRDLERTNDA